MNLQSVILMLVILLLVAVVLVVLYRNHKKGKTAFGCPGVCSSCPSAVFCKQNHKSKQ